MPKTPDDIFPGQDRPWQSPDIVSLREYVEQRMEAAERTVENARHALAEQVEQRFAATQIAIDKTEKSVAERLLTLTNALSTLSTRAEMFITRSEMGALLEKFDERSAANVQRQIYELRGIAELRMTGILREIGLREDALNTRLQLLNQATEKAAAAMDRRLEGMNEFREQLNNQSGTFITRNEFATALKGLGEKIDAVESALDKAEGRRTITTAVVALSSSLIISLLTGFVVYALGHR